VDSTNAVLAGRISHVEDRSATTRATRYVVLEEGCLMPVLLLLLLMTWSFVTIFLSHHTHFAIFR
jgi:hypothetical protein